MTQSQRLDFTGTGRSRPGEGDWQPLADRMRPRTLDEFVGQEHLLGEGQILRGLLDRKAPRSLILWGPPGTGKTTLARLYADATRRQVAISAGEEAMLLGTAMTAATAAGLHASLEAASKAMARPSTLIAPNEIHSRALDHDYRIFLRMQEHRRELATLA